MWGSANSPFYLTFKMADILRRWVPCRNCPLLYHGLCNSNGNRKDHVFQACMCLFCWPRVQCIYSIILFIWLGFPAIIISYIFNMVLPSSSIGIARLGTPLLLLLLSKLLPHPPADWASILRDFTIDQSHEHLFILFWVSAAGPVPTMSGLWPEHRDGQHRDLHPGSHSCVSHGTISDMTTNSRSLVPVVALRQHKEKEEWRNDQQGVCHL